MGSSDVMKDCWPRESLKGSNGNVVLTLLNPMGQTHEYPNMTDTFELILNTNTLTIAKAK